MNGVEHGKIVGFLWGIADDVLRDLYVRGKYRDVILPMVVIRRLDAVLESTKAEVLSAVERLSEDRVELESEDGHKILCDAAGQAFYNVSPFTMRSLQLEDSGKTEARFAEYLAGFSPNVQDILRNFDFDHQLPKLTSAGVLGQLIAKFLDSSINLSPEPVRDGEGRIVHGGLDNHAMGTIFEELVRRFNEENNEEAGEHWTPRDAVRLMARLVFVPVADRIENGTYSVYDAACGTGGMLTVAEETLHELADEHGVSVETRLYGQEINPETYAICKADMLLQGEGVNADNIRGGPEFSTLVNDAFSGLEFDFMLSNPPYGKSWKGDLVRLGGKQKVADPRFKIEHAGEPSYSLVTATSDGQLLFLANMASKMRRDSALGSRIAEVHNGSSLFTGEPGGGESNIRRWIIENDWLEAIVRLPRNMFYNTDIPTYVWVLSNRKESRRIGKVQLLDASEWFTPMQRSLGKKSCKLAEPDIARISDAFMAFDESEQSRVLPNEAFGYWKITVERPLRLSCSLGPEAVQRLRYATGDEAIRARLHALLGDALFDDFASVRMALEKQVADWVRATRDHDTDIDAPEIDQRTRTALLDERTWARDGRLHAVGTLLAKGLGERVFNSYHHFEIDVDRLLRQHRIKLPAADRRTLLRAASRRDDSAEPVISKRYAPGTSANPLYGRFETALDGETAVVEYEADSDLRDSEQVPMEEEGGIEGYFARNVVPHVPDGWINLDATKVGYEINFNRFFYRPPQIRTLEEIRASLRTLANDSMAAINALLDADSWQSSDPGLQVEIVPLKSVCSIQTGITLGADYSGQKLIEYPYLRVANVQAGRVDLTTVKTISVPASEAARSMLRPGDVLMTEGGDVDKLGRGCLWSGEIENCLHQNHVFAVRPDPTRLDPRFLVAYLATERAKAYFQKTAKQTTNLASTNKTVIGALRIPLPPLHEQVRIVEIIEDRTRPIDRLLELAAKETDLLREYAAQLTSSAVMGRTTTSG